MPSASDISLASGLAAPQHSPRALASLQQWLFSEAELARAPSILDGLSPEKERENRGKGVNFILQVGIMLKLPQITLATASVFLHRFYMRHSMVDVPRRPGYHYYSMAATCLFLATKVEENCRKMKELVVACVRVAQKDPSKAVDEQDREYWKWKDNILHNEDLLLEAVCFDVTLEPPYKTLFDLLVFFREENNKPLRNAAWAFVNDSCHTPLCLLYSSRTIAASALYAAAKHCDVLFPDDGSGRAWWDVISVDLREIRKACNYMAGFYENAPSRGNRDGVTYGRTPEDGDEATAKTRDRSGKDLELPRDDTHESLESPGSTVEHNGINAKRRREDDGGAEEDDSATEQAGAHINGANRPPSRETHDEAALADANPSKRQKINGADSDAEGLGGQGVPSVDAPHAPHSSLPAVTDDGSEEGEVES